ncbi:MAG: biopolymer transporter ExbD [Planctomycetaceae bacterium]|nr:biopolymer transporter ExbD [Planctomycetaceae bacterium]
MAESPLDAEDPVDEGPVLPRRRPDPDEGIDMTPMIDVTFLLLIFFMVTGINQKSGVELPAARYGKGVSEQDAVIITLADRKAPGLARVYLADTVGGDSLPDDLRAQEESIREYIEAARADHRTAVLVKAERTVHHRDVARVARAAGQVEGVTLHVAVLEAD